jgi:hypothetical protein
MLTFGAVAVGVLASSFPDLVSSLVWWLLGAGAAVVFYYGQEHVALAGGLTLVVVASSLWFEAAPGWHQISATGRILAVWWSVFIVFHFAAVWVVAYKVRRPRTARLALASDE